MKEVLNHIEQTLKEHQVISKNVQNLERITNDATAMLELDKAQDAFLPGRLEDQKKLLRDWDDSLAKISQGLLAHFEREEKGLLDAFEKYGKGMYSSALRALLEEHEGLRNRLVKIKKDGDELFNRNMSSDMWQGKAWGIRVYMLHTRKLLEAHALSEQELLELLRKEIRQEK